MTRFTSSTRKFSTLAGIALVLAVVSSPAAAHQPGEINCYKPSSRAAHAICASTRLSRVDDRMSRLFDTARNASETRYDLKALHDSQRAFVDKRDRCGGSRFCVWMRTKQRIRQLRRFIRHI